MPLLHIANGEVADKLTILEMKALRATDPGQLRNIIAELHLVREAWRRVDPDNELFELVEALSDVNESLWDIEDDLRRMEAEAIFDNRFIGLARSVYMTNDRRAALKREINDRTGSPIVEEKIHPPYPVAP